MVGCVCVAFYGLRRNEMILRLPPAKVQEALSQEEMFAVMSACSRILFQLPTKRAIPGTPSQVTKKNVINNLLCDIHYFRARNPATEAKRKPKARHVLHSDYPGKASSRVKGNADADEISQPALTALHYCSATRLACRHIVQMNRHIACWVAVGSRLSSSFTFSTPTTCVFKSRAHPSV